MPKDVNAAVATIKTKRTMDILKTGEQHPPILGSLLEFILQLIRARHFQIQTRVFFVNTLSCFIAIPEKPSDSLLECILMRLTCCGQIQVISIDTAPLS